MKNVLVKLPHRVRRIRLYLYSLHITYTIIISYVQTAAHDTCNCNQIYINFVLIARKEAIPLYKCILLHIIAITFYRISCNFEVSPPFFLSCSVQRFVFFSLSLFPLVAGHLMMHKNGTKIQQID